jgi:hypothetical protein
MIGRGAMDGEGKSEVGGLEKRLERRVLNDEESAWRGNWRFMHRWIWQASRHD